MGLDNRDPRPGEIARVGGHRRQPVLNIIGRIMTFWPLSECMHTYIDYFGEIYEGQQVIDARPEMPEPVDVPIIDEDSLRDFDEDNPDAVVEDKPRDGEPLQALEIPEKVAFEDLEVSATSPVQDLRRICRFFGINQIAMRRQALEIVWSRGDWTKRSFVIFLLVYGVLLM